MRDLVWSVLVKVHHPNNLQLQSTSNMRLIDVHLHNHWVTVGREPLWISCHFMKTSAPSPI